MKKLLLTLIIGVALSSCSTTSYTYKAEFDDGTWTEVTTKKKLRLGETGCLAPKKDKHRILCNVRQFQLVKKEAKDGK